MGEGISFSKTLCEENAAAEGVSNVEFRQGDAVKLDFPDASFDAVTSNYVYHNIPSRDRQELLLETLRVLKKGGTFALHDIFSKSKYGDMEAFAEKLRAMGYQRVEFIDTTNGIFMSTPPTGSSCPRTKQAGWPSPAPPCWPGKSKRRVPGFRGRSKKS